jgi:hypothetical protein
MPCNRGTGSKGWTWRRPESGRPNGKEKAQIFALRWMERML